MPEYYARPWPHRAEYPVRDEPAFTAASWSRFEPPDWEAEELERRRQLAER